MNKEVEKLAEEMIPEHPYPDMEYPAFAVTKFKRQCFIEGYKAASSNTVAPADNDFKNRVLSLLTNVGQMLQVVKSEWQECNCWSDWDEKQAKECVNLIREIYNSGEQTNPVDKSPNISQNDTKCEIHVGDTNVTYITFDPNNHKCTSNGNCIMCVHKTVGHCDLTENGNCFIEEQTKEVSKP